MKINRFFILPLLFVTILPCFGISYNITFTGSGASISVGDVLVNNLTTGTSVTVPAGNILNLSDGQTAVAQLSANDETIRIYPNSVEGISTISFFAKQAGNRLQDGGFASAGSYCSWWCSYTNAYCWILYNNYNTLLSGDNVIQCGMSIRCVKD